MLMPVIKISHKCVCARIGQGREETKVSDRFTSKDLSSCSSEPEGGEEGKTGLADNSLDILFLSSCLQSPKVVWVLSTQEMSSTFNVPSAQPSFASVCATKSRRVMVSACFQRDWMGLGLAAALGCASSVLWPRGPHMSWEPPFSSGVCCMGEPWTRFWRGKKKRVVQFYCWYLYCIYY